MENKKYFLLELDHVKIEKIKKNIIIKNYPDDYLTNEVNRSQASEAAIISRCANIETTINNLNTWLFSAGVVSTTFPITYNFNRS